MELQEKVSKHSHRGIYTEIPIHYTILKHWSDGVFFVFPPLTISEQTLVL